MDDLGRSLSFPFRDKNWVSKFIVAALFMVLSLFGLGIPILVGYFVQTVRRSMLNEEPLLPEWTDIGVMFVTGFKYCIVYLIYLLPAILLMIPAFLITVISGLGELPEGFAAIAAIYIFMMLLLYIPYVLAFTVFVPVITCRFALNEKISDALDIGAVVRDFRTVWPTAVVTAILTLILHSLSWIGIFLLIVGIFVTLFYALVVSAHLYGAVHRIRMREGGTA